MRKKNANHCTAVEINIKGVKNNFFIDKADVNAMLEKMNFGTLRSRPLNTFNLAGMESLLQQNEWIRSAELYFDNNDVLTINIVEREPVVRIFSTDGSSFYIDSSLKKLSLSNKFSARLPVFTNFPSTGSVVTGADSSLLADIKDISVYISRDPFWMAQIEQIDITPNHSFEMIPKIGNQVIVFGSADNFKEKFNNLLIFYKNVQSKVGWNKYSAINVTYKDQVVAVKRGAQDIKLDSLKTIELIKLLVANAQKQVNDSGNIQLVQPKEDNMLSPKPRDESFTEGDELLEDTVHTKQVINQPEINGPVSKSPVSPAMNNISHKQSLNEKLTSNERPNLVPVKKVITKPVIKKPPAQPVRQPKAVMQPKNDY